MTSRRFRCRLRPVRDAGIGPERRAARSIAVVNEALARRFFPDRDSIGRRLVYGRDRVTAEIGGVVDDVIHDDMRAAPSPTIYAPFAQFPQMRMFLVVRATAEPASLLAGSCVRAVRRLN